MIAAEKKEIFGVFDLVRKEQTDYLERLLPAVDIVAQKEIVGLAKMNNKTTYETNDRKQHNWTRPTTDERTKKNVLREESRRIRTIATGPCTGRAHRRKS
jgi:hypothetical protein